MAAVSVINQMLIDLERRRASGEERNRIPDHVRALPGSAADDGSRRMRLTVAAAVLAVAVIVAALPWWRELLPGVAKSPLNDGVAPALRSLGEGVAPRMSLDLAEAPKAAADNADAGLSTRSVIVTAPPEWANPRGESPVPQRATTPETARLSPPAREAATTAPREAAVSPPPAAAVAARAPVPPASTTIDKRVREQTPRQRAEAEYARGAAALHQGLAQEARAAFEAALQADPSLHAARQALVGVLLDARQQAEAAKLLQEGLQLSPAQSGFAMMLARLQLERGDLDAGVRTLAAGLDHASANADYLAFYAGLLQRQQKHAEAVGLFDRALRLRPNSGVWLLGMGMSLESLGRGDEAQEAFRRARASGNLPPDLQTYADQRTR